MKKQVKTKAYIRNILLIVFAYSLMSWGYVGHQIISSRTGLSFNEEMQQFNSWVPILAAHASDADERKAWDPTEGPKHYIDIDNYSQFISQGNIPQTLDSVIDIYGYSFVYDQGILPWATKTTFDSLVACFERQDWDAAVLFAADIGHYVADGHMPLHITRNYNGQYSGNSGIHSRYESTMINAYQSQIEYGGMQLSEIEDVQGYIFDYLYQNYTYVDSVLLADDYAHNLAGNTSSSAYKAALWEKTGSFTTELFKNASHRITELIYTAWKQAGSPSMTSGINDPGWKTLHILQQNKPNPFNSTTWINYRVSSNETAKLTVKNSAGKDIATLVDEKKAPGNYKINWTPDNQPAGIYYLIFTNGSKAEIQKMIYLRH